MRCKARHLVNNVAAWALPLGLPTICRVEPTEQPPGQGLLVNLKVRGARSSQSVWLQGGGPWKLKHAGPETHPPPKTHSTKCLLPLLGLCA